MTPQDLSSLALRVRTARDRAVPRSCSSSSGLQYRGVWNLQAVHYHYHYWCMTV
jgi:hypothetical protein